MEDIDLLLKSATEARREGQLEDARALAVQAIGAARLALANALRELGEVERASGNAQEARAAYEESVRLLRQCDKPLRFAHTLRHLGDVYYEQGQRDLAANAYDEALGVYRSHLDASVLDVANAVRSLAVLRDTEELWQEALDLYRRAGVQAGIDNCTRRLAALSNQQSD